MISLFINGALGFAMIVALLFCAGDLQHALDAKNTLSYPFIEIVSQAVQSTAGACVMIALIIILVMCSLVGLFAATSRMLWSFSRDRGTPFSNILSRVSRLLAIRFRILM